MSTVTVLSTRQYTTCIRICQQDQRELPRMRLSGKGVNNPMLISSMLSLTATYVLKARVSLMPVQLCKNY